MTPDIISSLGLGRVRDLGPTVSGVASGTGADPLPRAHQVIRLTGAGAVCLAPSIPAFSPDPPFWRTAIALPLREISWCVRETGAVTLEEIRPAWWDKVEQQFLALRSSKRNWDGYGAPPLDHSTLDRALALLATITERETVEPSLVPSAHGGVQLEWHTLRGDLEIELEPSGSISILYTDSATGADVELNRLSTQELRCFLQRLAS